MVAALLVACGDVGSMSATSPFEPPATERSLDAPDTAAGRHLAWALRAANQRDDLMSSATAERHLDASWLAKRSPLESVVGFYEAARLYAPFTVRELRSISEWKLDVVGESYNVPTTLSITVEPATGLVSGLYLRPTVEEAGFADIVRTIPGLGTQSQLLVAQIDGASCRPLHTVDAERPLEINAPRTLYILLALVDHIATGAASWDTQLALRDELRGTETDMKGAPAGTDYPLREWARAMVRSNDGTAADHLLHMLGRPAVEAAMRTAGYADPAPGTPFLSTREAHLLRRIAPAEIDRYLASTPEERRAFLDDTVAGWQRDDFKAADLHARYAEVGWFASVGDLCRVMAALDERARTPGGDVLDEILAAPARTQRLLAGGPWAYMSNLTISGFHVRGSTRLVRHQDGRRFVVNLGVVGPGDRFAGHAHISALSTRLVALLAEDASPAK